MRGLALFAAVYAALVCVFFWIVKDDWRATEVVTDPVNQNTILPEMDGETSIRQTFRVQPDVLNRIQLAVSPLPERDTDGAVGIVLQKESGEEICRWDVSMGDIAEGGQLILTLEEPLRGAQGQTAVLTAEGAGSMAFWYGNTRSAGKFDVEAELSGTLTLNGTELNGELVMIQTGQHLMFVMNYFWYAAAAILLICCGVAVWAHGRRRSGRLCVLNRAVDLARRYEYLLRVLVIRDFRVKYKDSILGVLWSFLNPLLMTFVYWFVFSTIFQSSMIILWSMS